MRFQMFIALSTPFSLHPYCACVSVLAAGQHDYLVKLHIPDQTTKYTTLNITFLLNLHYSFTKVLESLEHTIQT